MSARFACATPLAGSSRQTQPAVADQHVTGNEIIAYQEGDRLGDVLRPPHEAVARASLAMFRADCARDAGDPDFERSGG
jgi:hypothetical protein